MDFSKSFILAIVIVAVGAFLLGAVYEAMAFTEWADAYQNQSTNFLPGASVDRDAGDWGEYLYANQGFTTQATTTNLSRAMIHMQRMSSCVGDCAEECAQNMDIYLCLYEPPIYYTGFLEYLTEQTATDWPCDGNTPIYATSTTINKISVTDNYLDIKPDSAIPLYPSEQYYWNIRWPDNGNPADATNCITVNYKTGNAYTGGYSSWSVDNVDLRFINYKDADYVASTTWDENDAYPQYNVLGKDWPDISCQADTQCYSDYGNCYLRVYYNDKVVDTYNQGHYPTLYGVDLDHFFTYNTDYFEKEQDFFTTQGMFTNLDVTSLAPSLNSSTTMATANYCAILTYYGDNGFVENIDCGCRVKWVRKADIEAELEAKFGRDCDDVCDAISTTTPDEATFIEEWGASFRYGVECGLARAGCFLFTPTGANLIQFNQTNQSLMSQFPANVVTDWRAAWDLGSSTADKTAKISIPLYMASGSGYAAFATVELSSTTAKTLALSPLSDIFYNLIKYMIGAMVLYYIISRILHHRPTGEEEEEI